MNPLAKLGTHRDQVATVTRSPDTGEQGNQVTIADLPCTSPYPAGNRIRMNPNYVSITHLFELFTDPAEIKSGDTLTLGGRTFNVLHAASWGGRFMHLITEELFT